MRRIRQAGPLLLLVLLAAGCSDDGGRAEGEVGPTPVQTGPILGGEPLEGPPSTGPAPGEPTTYEEGVARLSGATTTVELARFLSPDGDVYCSLSELAGTPACELGDGPVKDLDVCDPGGPSVYVGRIELGEDGPVPLCNTDTIRGAQGTTVEHGTRVTWPRSPVECVVEEIGVTCLDDDLGAGFFLTPGRYLLLG